jgi:hypothetical protein
MRAPHLPYASDYASDASLQRARAAALLTWIGAARRAGAGRTTLWTYLRDARRARWFGALDFHLPA